jgi:MFS family permease
MKKAPLDAVPPAATARRESLWRLFDRTFAIRTFTIVVAYFFTVMSFYFLINWTPKVLVNEHFSLGAGISGAVLINAGGIVGGLVLGWFARHFGLIRLASLYMLLVAAAMIGFGYTQNNVILLGGLAAASGFFSIGSICSLYAITGAAYPVGIRNTGTGLVIGFGRAGGIIGPYIGGILIQDGWTRPEYYTALAVPSIVAALVVLLVSIKRDEPAAAPAAVRA